MRPGVPDMMVEERRLVWHAAELPGAVGCARQRNLAVDETTGEAMLVVQFDTEWRRPAGFQHRDQQWLLLAGSLTVGDDPLPAPGYLVLPGGALIPGLVAAAGTRAIVYRESSWSFQETAWAQPWADETFQYARLDATLPVTPGQPLVVREHGPDRSFLIAASRPGSLAHWPAGTHSAVLLSGQLAGGDRPLVAPLGQFGELGGAPVPEVATGHADHRWFALARDLPPAGDTDRWRERR